ncbi:MAG: CHAT domain-containing protein [Burkholderiales bacterium]
MVIAVRATLIASLFAAWPVAAGAVTWIEQAQSELTCTVQADAAERLSLDAPWLPTPLDAKGVTSYFRGEPRNERQARFRHLTLLAAVGWWADLINDQALRGEAYAGIGALADRYADESGSQLIFRQIARCSRAMQVGVLVALDQPTAAARAMQALVASYPQGVPVSPVEQWPLRLALREIDVDERARTELERLSVGRPARTNVAPGQDPYATFESLLQRSRSAEAAQKYEEMARLQREAVAMLTDQRGLDRFSVPFYRHALEELAQTRDADLGTLASRDPAFAANTLRTYLGTYDSLLRQAQAQFVADAREQLFFQYKIDNSLHALASLAPAMPRSSDTINDTTFRFAQLRSYGRLTLATLSAELARTPIDPQAHSGVERYFSLATQTAVWLRSVLATLQVGGDGKLPRGETLWQAFFTLDVFYNETAKELARYAAFVRQKAPAVAELATPRPLPISEFQRRLRSGEVIVATLVTPLDLYVWGISHDKVTFVRQRVTERDVESRVQRLRAGLLPLGAGSLPAFDAAAAYDLYRLVFEPLKAVLQGATDVIWYGHGPLGAVPPAVLVEKAPAKPLLQTPQEFASTRFLVDRYAFATLADLSLFAWHRDKAVPARGEQRLLGVGAPMLTTEEIAGGPRSRSYDLAGGLDGKALAELPKLAESVDEMKALAGVVGDSNATLWLGPEATERRFVGDSLKPYSLIALATHGFLPGEIRDVPEPALMLALEPSNKDRFDGILTSREIAGLQLDADLVILSACNTASADGRPRAEAFTGLSQAFFTAGTRSLMVSHWPVMSGAAVHLTVDTVAGGEKDALAWSRSLQRAMQSARRAGASSPIESHPSYWGPFVIVGDGR